MHPCRGATTSSKWGWVQFLGLRYYYLLQEKNRQVYSVWCSRLHNHTLFFTYLLNHTLFIKKLRKKLEGPSNFWEEGGSSDPPSPQWLHPCTHVPSGYTPNPVYIDVTCLVLFPHSGTVRFDNQCLFTVVSSNDILFFTRCITHQHHHLPVPRL